jgi:hypothetical protein
MSVIKVDGQKYLIKNLSWQQKIKINYFLAPLFYGVNKSPAQITREGSRVQILVKTYGNQSSAYRQCLISGWNYFSIGKIDSAIINFNEAYLLDYKNLETFYAFGSIIAFIDLKPNYELITHFKLNEKVSSGWDLMAFFGDQPFLDRVKAIQRQHIYLPNLSAILAHPKPPFFVDSSKYVMLKVIIDNQEGFYRMGRRNSSWTDYFYGTSKIMRTYNIVDGMETGEIKAYHKNGSLAAIFNKNNVGEIDGEYKVFDYQGQLVRIEYWKKNSSNKGDSKIIKEWEEDGETTSEIVNGKSVVYVWKDGKKILKK